MKGNAERIEIISIRGGRVYLSKPFQKGMPDYDERRFKDICRCGRKNFRQLKKLLGKQDIQNNQPTIQPTDGHEGS